MNLLSKIVSVILGIDKDHSDRFTKDAVESFFKPLLQFMARVLFVITLIISLFYAVSTTIIIIALIYYIIELEQRVYILEKELEVEKKVNREAYSTERYSGIQVKPRSLKL